MGEHMNADTRIEVCLYVSQRMKICVNGVEGVLEMAGDDNNEAGASVASKICSSLM